MSGAGDHGRSVTTVNPASRLDRCRVFPAGGGIAVSRIFLSHSSANNAEALALRDWLKGEGWDDVFLDLDPERGIKAGELWEEALRDAADRCEAVLFLVSRAWVGSEWCRDEFKLARHLRKRLFVILIEDIATGELPAVMTRESQLVRIAAAGETKTFSVVPPRTSQTVEVVFDADGLRRLKIGETRRPLLRMAARKRS
jgi:hypothetical protein